MQVTAQVPERINMASQPRRVLISGCSSGIGLELALQLAHDPRRRYQGKATASDTLYDHSLLGVGWLLHRSGEDPGHTDPATLSQLIYVSFFKKLYLFLFYVWGCFTCMCICITLTYLVSKEVRKDVRSPGAGVRNSCEPPCEC